MYYIVLKISGGLTCLYYFTILFSLLNSKRLTIINDYWPKISYGLLSKRKTYYFSRWLAKINKEFWVTHTLKNHKSVRVKYFSKYTCKYALWYITWSWFIKSLFECWGESDIAHTRSVLSEFTWLTGRIKMNTNSV